MRNLTPEMVAGFSDRYVSPAILIELFFDDETIRFWTGYGILNWGDLQFTGGGNLIGISPVEETQELHAKGLVATLSGIPSDLIAVALLKRVRGRPFRLHLGLVDTKRYVATEGGDGLVELEDGSGYVRLENELVDSPYRLFSGLMDVMEFTDDGKMADIRLSVENALIVGQRSKVRRFTQEEQRKIYPNDMGLEFINQLQDREIVW